MTTRHTRFFIDTADPKLVQSVLDRLPLDTHDYCVGVTTNPNAFSKVGVNTVEQMYTQLAALSATLEHYLKSYEIHVQVPNSKISIEEFIEWEQLMYSLEIDMPAGARFILKIPPRRDLLNLSTARFEYNVTGLADASTCFACANSDNVSYVSLIPGRMNQAGINEVAHMEKLCGSNIRANVITGSMRTIVGLKTAIRYGTIPTIGQRVWDLFTDRDFVEFSSWWNESALIPNFIYPEESTAANVELTENFFVEMDALGQPLYMDFLNK